MTRSLISGHLRTLQAYRHNETWRKAFLIVALGQSAPCHPTVLTNPHTFVVLAPRKIIPKTVSPYTRNHVTILVVNAVLLCFLPAITYWPTASSMNN